MLLNMMLKLLDLPDPEKNAFMEKVKAKGKKSNFAKVLLGL